MQQGASLNRQRGKSAFLYLWNGGQTSFQRWVASPHLSHATTQQHLCHVFWGHSWQTASDAMEGKSRKGVWCTYVMDLWSSWSPYHRTFVEGVCENFCQCTLTLSMDKDRKRPTTYLFYTDASATSWRMQRTWFMMCIYVWHDRMFKCL